MVTVEFQESSWMRVVPCFELAAVIGAAMIAGCGEDLGTCQMDLATQVVYASDGTPYYAGQGLVQFGCASGVCHSVYAEKGSRKGAPHGLNFDVGPLSSQSTAAAISALRDGLAQIHDNADDMYGEISEGSMPPGKAGERPDEEWKRADGTPAGLPSLHTPIGKSTVRNWLACGAPVVAGVTGAPADAAKLGAVMDASKSMPTGPATFDTIYPLVFKNCGSACHNPNGIKVGLDLSTQAAALSSLIDKAPHMGDEAKCSSVSNKLIVPGNCKDSLVYQKLKPNPPCGSQMPIGPALPEASVQALCDWIDAGAK